MSHAGPRRCRQTVRKREAEIRGELPGLAKMLRERARRWRMAATNSERTGSNNLRAGGMRAVAQALVDAADLLEQREFLITLRPAALCKPGEARRAAEKRAARLTPSPP